MGHFDYESSRSDRGHDCSIKIPTVKSQLPRIDQKPPPSPIETTVDPMDNPLSKFMYNRWIGRIIVCSLMIASVGYFIFRLFDPHYVEVMIKGELWRHLKHAPYGLLLELLLNLTVFVAYPITKCTRNSTIYTLTGLIIGALLFVIGFSDLYFDQTSEVIRFLISIESIRLQLKLISFLVEMKNEKTNNQTTFGCLTYFLFAPTLLYQPNYPRTHEIRWWRVANSIVWTFITIAVFMGIYYEFALQYLVIDFRHFTWAALRTNIIANSLLLVVVYMYLITFYYFEIWCGMWAELLTFADHRFFGAYLKDTSVNEIVTNVNRVVALWIKKYLFIPLIKKSHSRTIAFVTTLSLSISYHELVYSFTLKQFILMAHLVGPLCGLYFMMKPSPFVRILQSILFIFGLMVYVYPHALEYSARIYCDADVSDEPFIRIVPLFVTCLGQAISNQTNVHF